ncbi:ribbon-helix-helix protein, CopG family [Paracoccus caeni]|uniref:Ribbon-helix-helix protein, CopG family n=2 Tax=Paracoccus caeni TaxID=657651 RepID=A0A934SHH8_9RHOB|nr:ribbon-helix-helix protein, CopG family [Paracoccus caeni]
MAKKRGRPSVDSESINLRLPRELIQALDDRRRIEEDLPTRPEMIRRALVEWLAMTGDNGGHQE